MAATDLPLNTPLRPQARVLSANDQRVADLEGQGSRISRIHNPVGKTLATIGDIILGTFAPRAEMLTPGTEGNYMMHLARARAAQAGEQAGAENEARTRLQEAQAQNQEAEAQARLHPNTKLSPENLQKTLVTDQGIMQWNPDTNRFDIPAGQAPAKEETEGKTVTTDQGIMQWDPKTKTYGIKVGDAPGAKGGTVHQADDGTFIMAHPDGTATRITIDGQPVKGKPAEGKEGELPLGDRVSQLNQALESRYQVLHPGAKLPTQYQLPANATQKDFDRIDKLMEAEERASGTKAQQDQARSLAGTWTFAKNADNQDILVNTKTGEVRDAPQGAHKAVAAVESRETQGKVIQGAGDELIKQIEANRGKIGNLGSYVNQWINGTPIADPAVSALMTSIESFAALQPGLHGFRSHDAMREFAKVIGGVPKNPDALIASIRAIQKTAGIVAREGRPEDTVRYSVPGAPNPYNIPKGQEQEFLKDHPNAKKL